MSEAIGDMPGNALSGALPSAPKWHQPTPRKLLVAFIVLCFVFEGLFIFNSYHKSLPPQGLVFFPSTVDMMADYVNVISYTKTLDVYLPENGERAYPPLCYAFFVLQRQLCDGMLLDVPGRVILFCMLFMTASALLFFGSAYQALREKNIILKSLFVVALFLTGIFLFSFERGNLILLTVGLVMIFINFYQSRDPWLKEVALLALAFAVGFKLLPAVFGCLLLYNKDYKAAVRLAIYGLILIFIPFLMFDGGFANIPVMFGNMKIFIAEYTQRDVAFGRVAFEALLNRLSGGGISFYGTVYPVLRGLTLLGFLCTFWETRPWLRLFMLVAVILQVPVASNVYNGLFIIPAVIVFFNNPEGRWLDWVFVTLFVFLFSPLQIFIIVDGQNYVSITAILQSFVFQIIFLLALGQTVVLNARLLIKMRQQNRA